jgi:hypothetical protein
LNLYKKWIYVILAALLMVSFGMAESILTNTTEQFTVEEDNLRGITFIDIPPVGPSLGDAFYFNGTLHSENETGPIIGELFGSTTVVRLAPGKAIEVDNRPRLQRPTPYENATDTTAPEQRLIYMIFAFNNKTDQIVVGGVADYLPQDSKMLLNQTAVRPILGGTGKYLGVRGQLVTSRDADGNYTHVFTILRQ